MGILSIVAIVLLVNILFALACTSSCSVREHNAKNHFKSKLLRQMGMTSTQMEAINKTFVEHARTLLPMMNSHPHESHESFWILAKQNEEMDANEYSLSIPDSVRTRSTSSAALSFTIGPIPDDRQHIIVDIKAREATSDEFTTHRQRDVTVYPSTPKHFKTKIANEILQEWLAFESQNIVLSITIRDVDTNEIISSTEDEPSLIKNVKMEIRMVSKPNRKRRDAEKKKHKCKSKTDTNQECCVMTKSYTAAELNMHNLVSPMNVRLSWCQGQCKEDSSYKNLFGQLNRNIMDNGKVPGEQCCHADEYEHLEIIYVNDRKEVRAELLFDIIATKCACD